MFADGGGKDRGKDGGKEKGVEGVRVERVAKGEPEAKKRKEERGKTIARHPKRERWMAWMRWGAPLHCPLSVHCPSTVRPLSVHCPDDEECSCLAFVALHSFGPNNE